MTLYRTTTKIIRPLLLLSLAGLIACARPFTVSVNNQPVYDPRGRINQTAVIDADLQGCINLAVRQQNLDNPAALTVLSCSDSGIESLENVGQLRQLRFLDVGNNNITNITPLEELTQLGGLNLINNQISDISPLLNIPSLATVSLLGNNNIACEQLRRLAVKLGGNLTPPTSCRQ